MSLLLLENVCAAYGGRPALEDVSLRVGSGEIVGLVGPNGSGKTTAIRVATGVLSATAGNALLGGDPVTRLRPSERARRAAVVAQTVEIPGGFTAGEVVMLARAARLGLLQGESAADRAAVDRALQRASAMDLRDRLIGTLSGGERQRVLIARALAQEAPLLLLDEPTSHLDIHAQADVVALLRDLVRQDGYGALVALHDLTLAAQFCDRLVLLAEGCVRSEGSPQEVLTPEILEAAYGARPLVLPHPHTGRPIVVPALDGTDEAGW